jgi:lipopolysaccharide transport system ATP-binding protein
MASDIAIHVEALGKKYLIGHRTERERYTALRDVIARNVRAWGRSARAMLRGEPIIVGDETEEFWALRDVSFDIRRGEVVGIIGRNGAGKSTLLKILSRITEPSQGRATIEGRVASLLEVGTGFHPELTGRENIYLNGAILGMTRREIRAKFDEIVAFAEVERFLDTPVKRYSSGMYVRLAFAVAAHMDPEILVIDEVLAVGDAEFQKKCLGKMQGVAGGGRTVVFVSHNMATIQSLCSRSILLRQGAVVCDGTTEDAISRHLATSAPSGTNRLEQVEGRRGRGQFRFVAVRVGPANPRDTTIITTGKPLKFELEIAGPENSVAARSSMSIVISNRYGEILIVCDTDASMSSSPLVGASTQCTCTVPDLPLSGSEYFYSLYLDRAGVIEDWIDVAGSFQVLDSPFFGTARNCAPGWEGKGVLVSQFWNVTPLVLSGGEAAKTSEIT